MADLDPTDLLALEQTQREYSETALAERSIEVGDFQWLMSDKRGRRFVWRLLAKTGVFRSSFTGNSETFFREGARNVGLMLLAEINEHSPEQYTLMLKEQREYANRKSSRNR